MDEISRDGRLRHDIPMHVAKRPFFGLAGLFCIVMPTWELYRGVWPLSVASPFFLFIILGAYAVGIPLVYAAIFSPAVRWIVRRGRIDIVLRNPIFLHRHHVLPGIRSRNISAVLAVLKSRVSNRSPFTVVRTTV